MMVSSSRIWQSYKGEVRQMVSGAFFEESQHDEHQQQL